MVTSWRLNFLLAVTGLLLVTGLLYYYAQRNAAPGLGGESSAIAQVNTKDVNVYRAAEVNSGTDARVYQNFSLRPSIDEEIDTMSFRPPSYLDNFKNPCWYEQISDNNIYWHNSIKQSYEGHRRGHIRWNLKAMQHILDQRMRTDATGTGWRLRCLPYFYLVGFSKCGTTDLYAALINHPHIHSALKKEPTYWNRIRYHVLQNGIGNLREHEDDVTSPVPRPFRHYVDIFDPIAERILRNDKDGFHPIITGDGTPSYIYDFDGWKKMKANKGLSEPKYILADILHQLSPKARIIIILRNPADRLFSDFRYFIRKGAKSDDIFYEIAAKGIKLMDDCLKNRAERFCLYDHEVNSQTMPLRVRVGMYYPYIRDWLRLFPRQQVYITRLEDYSANRSAIINEITNFLDLEPMQSSVLKKMGVKNASPKKIYRNLTPLSGDARAMIDNFYKPWNQKLAALLKDEKYLWNDAG